MKALNFILGIIAFVVGIFCLVYPFDSFLALSLIVAIFLAIVGIGLIAVFFVGRKDRSMSPRKPALGVVGLVLGIALVLIGILSLVIPSMDEMLDMLILIVFAVWMIVMGIVSIFEGSSMCRQDAGYGILWIVIGAICVIAGIYGLLHIVLFEEALGYVLGALMMLFGLEMICCTATDPDFRTQ